MGEHQVAAFADASARRAFMRAILRDIQALEAMIERGMIEEGVQRVGVEQEMFLVDAANHAAPRAYDLLDALQGDDRFQSEVALFNLEANLGAQPIGGSFLRDLERELNDVIGAARAAGAPLGIDVALTGTLPTLTLRDVAAANLTPEVRYRHLDQASLAAQGGAISLMVDGLDRFERRFDSVVIEGANTSVQLHLQVEAANAARLYNLAQLITAPLLAASTNSPILLGKRVWQETRVAVFERAFDDRSSSQLARGVPTRVGFGSSWLANSLVELFRDNVARYQAIMTRELTEDPLELVEQGKVPRLQALTLHNGTVWRWNRPCYGITAGKPHLRIENRILPSGPTVLDEVANAALFYGLMVRLDREYGEVSERLSFADARANFLASAHYGLEAGYRWLDGRAVGARELLRSELLPLAREGLAEVGVPDADVARYIDVLDARVDRGRTGAKWLLDSLAQVPEALRPAVCAAAVNRIRDRQQGDTPVHAWEDIECDGELSEAPSCLRDIMTRDVFTVRPGDVVDLAASVMHWKHIRHVPVEDDRGRLVGLLSARELLRLQAEAHNASDPLAVSDAMDTAPPIAPPDLAIAEAMQRMLENDAGCLLVVRGTELVGIVTERDLVRAAQRGPGDSA